MDSGDAIQLLILVILLGLSGFFSSAETALITVNRIRIKNLAEEGNKRAGTLLKVIDDSGKMLSAILIGNNIVNLSASSLATLLATRLFGSKGVGIATGILTVLILVFGEITPKTLATTSAEKLALAYAGMIHSLMIILTPVIFIINKLSRGFLFLLRVDPDAKTDVMTENELRTIVDVSHEDGVIESEERQMIYNVFDFGDSLAKDIMIPRVDMIFAHIDATRDELIDIFKKEKFTRLPVYEESTDDVIGILNMKDLLLYDRDAHFSVRDILREAYFTYEYKKTSELMIEMRKDSNNLAIVLDEYGATAGLITLEDLLEEIVGEIRDEYDEDEKDLIRSLSEREYLVEGSMKLDDVNDALGLNLDSEDYDSVGGLIIELLDRLPEEHESVETEDGIILEVEKIDKNRIDTVHLTVPAKQEEEEEESAS
ncbi:MAG: HlyC/CorC family transporter [Lachnospiraceae bacterium]|nr:HlyC/CorC family transporter [Lachnospiraceae bacterium]